MKTKLLLSIILLSQLSFSASSQHYIQTGDSPTENHSENWSYTIYKDSVCFTRTVPMWSSFRFPKPEKIECDIVSFKVLKNEYAKDKDHFFYKGKKLKDVDKESFSILEIHNSNARNELAEASYMHEYYAKDRNHVFYGEKIMNNADPMTFILFSHLYGKDNRQAYIKGNPIVGSDANTFIFIEGRFAKDKNHVYHLGEIISDNPESFQILDYDSRYAKDKDDAFYWWGVGFAREIDTIREVNTDNFGLIAEFIATDGERVFWHGQDLPDADPATIRFLNFDFTADKDQVYFKNKKIDQADPATFRLIEVKKPNYYSKDINSVFFQDSRITYADPVTFIPLSYQWGKDKKFIYFENNLRKDIDYKTFVVDKHFARDKNYIYSSLGKIVKENTSDEME